jgi:hypothetical protein
VRATTASISCSHVALGIRLLRRRLQTIKRVCSLLLSTAVRDFRRSQLGLQPAWLPQTILRSVSNSGYEEPVRSADSPQSQWSRSWSTEGNVAELAASCQACGTALATLHAMSTLSSACSPLDRRTQSTASDGLERDAALGSGYPTVLEVYESSPDLPAAGSGSMTAGPSSTGSTAI